MSLAFGEVAADHFTSTAAVSFTDTGAHPIASLSREAKADLRRQHFSLGVHEGDYVSTAKEAGASVEGAVYVVGASEARRKLAALRKANWSLGVDEVEYTSEHGAQFAKSVA